MEYAITDIIETDDASITIQISHNFIARILRAMPCTRSSIHECFYCEAADMIDDAIEYVEQNNAAGQEIVFDKYYISDLLERLRSASYGDGMQPVHDLFDDVTIEVEKLYKSL